MVKVYLIFLMEEYIKDTIKKIKNMDMESLFGLIIENIKDYGRMENNMVWEFILDNMEMKNKENGRKENESDGFHKMKIMIKNLMFLM